MVRFGEIWPLITGPPFIVIGLLVCRL
jgi:hypothetical protein